MNDSGDSVQGNYLYEIYLRYLNEANRCRSASDLNGARQHYLKASEALLKLSAVSNGELKQKRYNNAIQLKDYALKLSSAQVESAGSWNTEPSETDVVLSPVVAAVKFGDIIGHDDAKEKIKMKMVYPFLHPELASLYKLDAGGGVLLYGPPGTGKTMLAQAVSSELHCPFFWIRASQVLDKWVGESEKSIKAIFSKARSYEKSVLFIDEVESLLPKRDTEQTPVMKRVVSEILSELDGFGKKTNKLLFIGATNIPWELDDAILRPGRFDEKAYLGLPDEKQRESMFSDFLKDVFRDDDIDVTALSRRCDGYSGADIKYVVEMAKQKAFKLSMNSTSPVRVSQQLIEATIDTQPPSVPRSLLERYKSFNRALQSRFTAT